MTETNCGRCGMMNRLADEVCQHCGAELKAQAAGFNAASNEYRRPEANFEGGEGFKPATFIGPFNGVGAVLSPTIEIFKDNIWLITKLIFVIFAPFEIFKALSFDSKDTRWQVVAGGLFLALVCKMLVAPSLIYALVTVMRTGVAPGLNECYRWGLSKLWIMIACAFMSWLLQVLGLICLIIPGIILGLAFELVYPIAALENRTPVEVLKRSYELTKGYRWKILGAGIVLGILCYVILIPAGLVTGVLAMNGIRFWPLDAAVSMIGDIVNESTTILSLVIYLSILRHTPSEEATQG
ncbi:MAG: hypothetical protein ICV60_13660 [Pyrinomonadaceae bacterium]|nr:hypothetical protein [Pyrinomonadaceae bacterium]